MKWHTTITIPIHHSYFSTIHIHILASSYQIQQTRFTKRLLSYGLLLDLLYSCFIMPSSLSRPMAVQRMGRKRQMTDFISLSFLISVLDLASKYGNLILEDLVSKRV